jgi:gliding motility-associated-like protein
VIFNYTIPGSYILELIVENEICGEVEILTEDISEHQTILVLPEMFIPNIFTPNADELNREWKILVQSEGYSFKKWDLNIYNRWGDIIFETEDLDKGWNGMLGNDVVAEGVYYFTLKYVINCSIEQEQTLSGNITVIH